MVSTPWCSQNSFSWQKQAWLQASTCEMIADNAASNFRYAQKNALVIASLQMRMCFEVSSVQFSRGSSGAPSGASPACSRKVTFALYQQRVSGTSRAPETAS